ncbi:MAG TPA: exopolysaccharide transport family protein [Xanthobacteraceae bacterium]
MRFDVFGKVRGRLPKRKAAVVTQPKPVPGSAPSPALASSPAPASEAGDLDLRAIWQALVARKRFILIPTLLAAILSTVAVNMITPRYKSEARILIDGRENVFLRPNGERSEERSALDPEAVASQVQLLLSRDLARQVIKKNKLAELPEFDPVLRGVSPVRSLLGLLGILRDPLRMTPEERVMDSYYSRLTAYAVDKSRVVVVEFQSQDPDLAARVANSIADGYLVLQQDARQQQAKTAGQWLSGEIDGLRKKVADAESRADAFRSKSSLFVGTNNTTLSNQQLGELNTQLNNARAQKSDAESKARLIREMLKSGRLTEASEVLNTELIRRLSEQRVTLRAQLAEQSATLLDSHPRIKELKAQIGDLDKQIREEATKVSRSLENDARIAAAKVESLSAGLDQLKRQATSTNGQDVELRALEREAKAERDLLESYLAKYREATARENIDAAPADGRIISRAFVSNTPAYPKKLPIILIATLATLMATAGFIVSGELLRMTSPRGLAPLASTQPMPAAAAPVMPIEPTFAVAEPVADSGAKELVQLADNFGAPGVQARKIAILGTTNNERTSEIALTLARLLARQAKVVLIDLSASPMLAAAVDPSAPGVAELVRGEASFGEIISRDRLSSAHLVGAGRTGGERTHLQSQRLIMTVDALVRTYDHVLLNAGTANDLPAALLTADARAVVAPDPSMNADARRVMSEQLKAVGFVDVTMLGTSAAAGAATAKPRVVAA